MVKALDHVEGFLYLGEAWALHETVRLFPTRDSLTVVEIGSWKGRSTIALGLGMLARGSRTGRIYAIDPHTGSKELMEVFGSLGTYSDFMANIAKAQVTSVVEPIVATSLEARKRFKDQSVDVLFVDGSHEYLDVLQDMDAWLPAVANGGAVIFNDPSSPGVYRALRRRILGTHSAFRDARLVENSLFLVLRRQDDWSRPETIALGRLRLVLAMRYQANRLRPMMPRWFVRVGHAVSARMLSGASYGGEAQPSIHQR